MSSFDAERVPPTPDATEAVLPESVVAAEAERSCRNTATGMVTAAVGLAAVALAPALSLAGYGYLWSWLGILAVAAMTAICGFQLRCWRRARSGDQGVWRLRTASWAAHVLAYLVALLGLYALLMAMVAEGPLALAYWLWLIGGLGMLYGLASGAVQYLRESGPPGTLPAHVRRLVDAAGRLGED